MRTTSSSRSSAGPTALVVGALLACGGCGPGDARPSPTAAEVIGGYLGTAPTPALLAALRSGAVDEEAYRSGFERYAACLRDAGHAVVVVDETGPVLDYRVRAEAAADDDRCYHSEFAPLDDAWQLANADTSRWELELGECLATHGITPGRSLDTMEFQRAALRVDLSACLA